MTPMSKISISKRSERFSPDGGIFGTKVIEGNLDETLTYLMRTYGHDVNVSNDSSNSNIVGLGVDFDLEIQDEEDDEEV